MKCIKRVMKNKKDMTFSHFHSNIVSQIIYTYNKYILGFLLLLVLWYRRNVPKQSHTIYSQHLSMILMI